MRPIKLTLHPVTLYLRRSNLKFITHLRTLAIFIDKLIRSP